MEFALLEPPPELAGAVKTIWIARGAKQDFDTPNPIVPDGCVEIVLNLGDRFIDAGCGQRQPRALLAGQMTRPVVALPTGSVNLIGIRFWTGRAGGALRLPMWMLQDQLIPAGTVLPSIDTLADDLRDVPLEDRIAHLGHELTRRFREVDPQPLRAVEHALELIERSRGQLSIERIARTVGMTRRHLERRFRDEVGLRPKHVARIARIQHVLRIMTRDPLKTGAAIAVDCGYSDQAHLIRECRALTGRTFSRLEAGQPSLSRLMRH